MLFQNHAVLGGKTGAYSPSSTSVFSIDTWTAGTNQSIVNNLALSDGGLFIGKSRSSTKGWIAIDDARGTNEYLRPDTQALAATTSGMTFNSDGYSMLSSESSTLFDNGTNTMVGFSFLQKSRFFSRVLFTGSGSNQTIPHGLGVAPGMVIIKARTSSFGSTTYSIWHKGLTNGTMLHSDRPDPESDGGTAFSPSGSYTPPDATNVYIGDDQFTNGSGGTFVMYSFADDTLSTGLIRCGSFTGTGSVNLGWQPRWILAKNRTSLGDWYVFDATRGWTSASAKGLILNASNSNDGRSASEFTITSPDFFPTATGFSYGGGIFPSGDSTVYVAIRS